MRKISLLSVVATLLTLSLAAPLCAQESKAPALQKLENAEPPTITIREPSSKGAKISEQRDHGVVKKVKVNANGSTYYLRPKGAKASPPMDAHESNISVPQWVVKEFDSSKDSATAENASQSNTPPPSSQPAN